MSKIHVLKGIIQNYAWGGQTFIPDLLNIQSTHEPYAEYWLGAHKNAPSMLLDYNKTLDSWIADNTVEILGDDIANRFGILPFLFKVLDVNDMLSIQVHPSKLEAKKGYEIENKLQIPLNAPNRNYKDENHKPEIMVALSDFWLLHGFLPEKTLKNTLQTIPEFGHLVTVFESEGYRGLYKKVMEESEMTTREILQPLIDRILPKYKSGELKKSSADFWAAKAYLSFCKDGKIDKGIYSIYFFNIVNVLPGEAVFQGAGIPHAYLEGQNMELMANSDNVLRGGLTPKHVDVSELLKHVCFEATHPKILKGDIQSDGLERIYKSPAPDFELSKIDLDTENVYSSTNSSAAILLVLDGDMKVYEEDGELNLKKGEACFIDAKANFKISTPSTVTAFKATTPI